MRRACSESIAAASSTHRVIATASRRPISQHQSNNPSHHDTDWQLISIASNNAPGGLSERSMFVTIHIRNLLRVITTRQFDRSTTHTRIRSMEPFDVVGELSRRALHRRQIIACEQSQPYDDATDELQTCGRFFQPSRNNYRVKAHPIRYDTMI